MEDEKEDKQETPATVTLTKEQFEALVGKKEEKKESIADEAIKRLENEKKKKRKLRKSKTLLNSIFRFPNLFPKTKTFCRMRPKILSRRPKKETLKIPVKRLMPLEKVLLRLLLNIRKMLKNSRRAFRRKLRASTVLLNVKKKRNRKDFGVLLRLAPNIKFYRAKLSSFKITADMARPRIAPLNKGSLNRGKFSEKVKK